MFDAMEDVKDLLTRAANPTEEDIKKFGIHPGDLENLGVNLDQLIADADKFQKRWNENMAKHEPSRAARLTEAEFVIDKYNEFKNDYDARLTELKPQITNYESLSSDAKEIFELSAQVLAEQKKIDFQNKLIEKGELSKRDKKQAQDLIARTEKKIKFLTDEINLIESGRLEEEKKADDLVDIGGPKNLLKVTEEEKNNIPNHSIVQYLKLKEASAFADETIARYQQVVKDIKSGIPTKKDKRQEREETDAKEEKTQSMPLPDDYVLYTQEGKKLSGIVDSIDEEGNYIVLPIIDGKPVNEPIVILKDDIELDKKYYEETGDFVEEPNEFKDVEEEIEPKGAAYDIAYMIRGKEKIPTIISEDLHRYLLDPKNDLSNVTVEFFINDYGKKWLKDKNIIFEDIDKNNIPSDILDNIPIGIRLLENGKSLIKEELFYHLPSFKKGIDEENTRKNRRTILFALLSNGKAYSNNLSKSNGRAYNNVESKGSAIERLGIKLTDAQLAVSRKNGKVYTSNNSTIPGLQVKGVGSVYVATKKTPNGTEAWVKLVPHKLTREHAEILWDAIVTRYSGGQGGYMATFPDDRVEGLTVGEVINMLTLFGDRKTNPNHPNNKDMEPYLYDKALFIHSGRLLTFGSRTVDIFEDNLAYAEENKTRFIDWAIANKNYSVPLALTKMGISLNEDIVKRNFRIGSWKNQPNLTYGQFLLSAPINDNNEYALETDVEEYKDTGSVKVRPYLTMGTIESDVSDEVKKETIEKVPKLTKVSKAQDKIIKESNEGNEPLSIKSALDIINLPAGSVIYYNFKEVSEGKFTGVTIPTPLGRIINDPNLGRVLTIDEFLNEEIKHANGAPLSNPEYIKNINDYVSFLSRLANIDEIFADVSNAVSFNESNKETHTETPKTSLIEINTKHTPNDINEILGMEPMLISDIKGKDYSIVNLPKELKWLKKKFGKQNVKTTDTLIKLASNGRLAFSIFTSDCIYVYEGSPEGVLYHESFHRVLSGYLSEKDRQAIYTAARKEYGLSDASDFDVEQRLAEEFRAYKLSNIKPKSRTILQKFKDLLSFIYTYFTGRTKLTSTDIDKLFDSINRGQFRHSKIDIENANRLKNIQIPMPVDIGNVEIIGINNNHDLDKIVKYLSYILITTNEIDNLNKIKDIKMTKLFDFLDKEDEKNPGRIQMLRSAVENGQKLIESGSLKGEDLQNMIKKTAICNNLLNIFKIVTSSQYRNLFENKLIDTLRAYNIKTIVEEDENGEKIWDKASFTVDTKDNILASVKFVVATLPKEDGIDSTIGIPEFVDFNSMWNSIMHHLWDVNGSADMMERLKGLSIEHPYKVLLNRIKRIRLDL